MLLDPNQESMLFQNDHTFSLRMILLNEFTTALKILGVHIDESPIWEKHIDEVTKKISYAMGAIRKLKDFADRETLAFVYNALAQSDFDYCCEVWDSPGDSLHRDYRGFRIGAQELLWTAETRLVNQKLLCKLKVGSLLPNKQPKTKLK